MKTSNVVLLVLVCVILSSCEGAGGLLGGGAKPKGPDTSSLYRGTEGLRLTLMNEISDGYENNAVESAFKVENKGPYRADAVLVMSTDDTDMVFADGSNVFVQTFSLDGKDPVNPFDKSEAFPFTLDLSPVGVSEEDTKEAALHVSLCYDYSGELTTPVCIDKDPANIQGIKKNCQESQSLDTSNGQGGPVSISKVDYETVLGADNSIKPMFKIYLSNNGRGIVRRSGIYQQACSGEALGDESSAVSVDEISFSTYHLGDFDCTPNPYIFKDEESQDTFITCILKPGKLSREVGSSFKTDLFIKISYGYELSDPKTITIHKLKR